MFPTARTVQRFMGGDALQSGSRLRHGLLNRIICLQSIELFLEFTPAFQELSFLREETSFSNLPLFKIRLQFRKHSFGFQDLLFDSRDTGIFSG